MRLSQILRAHGFGNLAKVYGITVFKLSPFEQKAFAGTEAGIQNMVRRIRANFFRVAPPFVVGFLIFTWAEAKHVKLSRKDPNDYIDDDDDEEEEEEEVKVEE